MAKKEKNMGIRLKGSPLKYLYKNPKTGILTGLWACGRSSGKYWGTWPPGLIWRVKALWYHGGRILEPFGGVAHIDISTDLNRDLNPTVLADAHRLPFRDNTFSLVLMDPPYSQEYEKLYHSPRVHLVKAIHESMRVLKPGGILALLHFLCPKNPSIGPFRRIALIGITCGVNHRIRALSVWRKDGPSFLLELRSYLEI